MLGARSKKPTVLAAALYAAMTCTTAVAGSAAAPVVVNDEDLFLYIRGGPVANRLVVDVDRSTSEFVISDAHEIVAQTNCRSVTATEVRCSWSPAHGMSVDLRRGDDHAKLLAASHPGGVAAGPGDDRVVASAGRNELSGAEGHDFIKAGAGNDLLIGDVGHDTFYAGGGNDRVHALDEEVDRVIDCGSGDDIAWVDPRDPPTRHCEKIDFSDGRFTK